MCLSIVQYCDWVIERRLTLFNAACWSNRLITTLLGINLLSSSFDIVAKQFQHVICRKINEQFRIIFFSTLRAEGDTTHWPIYLWGHSPSDLSACRGSSCPSCPGLQRSKERWFNTERRIGRWRSSIRQASKPAGIPGGCGCWKKVGFILGPLYVDICRCVAMLNFFFPNKQFKAI